VTAAVATLLASRPADAQTVMPIDPQLFHPAPGPKSVFGLDLPEVPTHLGVSAGMFVNYAQAPLRVTEPDGRERALVPSELGIDFVASLSLFQAMEIGVDVPIQRLGVPNAIEPGFTTTPQTSVGDLRLQLKFPVLRKPLLLGGALRFSLPTGDETALTGVRGWVFGPTALAELPLGKTTVAFELGYLLRRREPVSGDFEIDDEVAAGIGVIHPILPDRLDVRGELRSWTGIAAPTFTANAAPIDANVGGAYHIGRRLSLYLGAGRGVSEGYGTPAFRVLGGVRLRHESDGCAAGPEDFDGFRDGDFCADPDNDGDHLADEIDTCPNDAEDADGFEDQDGCKDPDNDADAVADAGDRCPLQAEDRDGHEDVDGCPDDDNDGDGLADHLDDCAMDPEDVDQFQDEDGCPEPGPAQATVTVTDTRILISERVYFDFERETIRSVSLPLLQQVAQVLVRTPRIRKIRIEGYTDGSGDANYNLDLSYRRARSVLEYLVSQGVERNRVTHIGYGETRPVASDDTPEGQALNRRVEFTILETEGAAQQGAPEPERPRRRRREAW